MFTDTTQATMSRRTLLCPRIMLAVLLGGALASDRGHVRGDGPPETPAFQPGDISIGEPIALPFTGSRPDAGKPAGLETPGPANAAAAPSTAVPNADRLAPIGPRAFGGENRPAPAVGALSQATGQGWLGLAIAESSVPGRWIVDTVAPVGPAASSGILPGDEVRGINGIPLRTAEEVSQALTAIAPGQMVGLAIARGEQVRDVQLTAAARPQQNPVASAPLATAPVATAPVASAPLATVPVINPPAASAGVAAGSAAFGAAPAFVPAVPAGAPDAGRRLEQPATTVLEPAPGSRYGAGSTSPPEPPAFVGPQQSEPAAALPPAAPGPSRTGSPPTGGRTALGVRTVPIDEGLQARFRLPAASGAYVIGVVQDLPASKAGVPPGSVIVSLGDQPVRSPDDLTRMVTSGPVGRPMTLEYVLPGGAAQRADVVLQTLEKPLEDALVGSSGPAAAAIPTLEPGPTGTTVRRPITTDDAGMAAAMRDEIRWLRARLQALEQRLDSLAR